MFGLDSSLIPEGSVLFLVLKAGLVVKIVILILLLMSIISWAIIFSKSVTYRRAAKETEKFQEYFWKSRDLNSVDDNILQFKYSPVAQVFHTGYQEFRKINGQKNSSAQDEKDNTVSPRGMIAGSADGIDNISRALRRATVSEITKLESALTFLATTGSTAPFIGLFGTVWGIMTSFHGIGLKGSASLAVVAPGISEALIATAIGLVAAIPAVVAYNYLLRRVRVFSSQMDNFSSDFLNIIKRYLMQDSGRQ
ncbi:MAG: protein TolQ [Candidatus Schekmanbacteria bacterium]|nr:MAG: protein TolQ [Candidatus Schekmanbacteria bacterium]